MEVEDIELRRLTEQLREIDSKLAPDDPAREALKKAGIALIRGFGRGDRTEIEVGYERVGLPLDGEQQDAADCSVGR